MKWCLPLQCDGPVFSCCWDRGAVPDAWESASRMIVCGRIFVRIRNWPRKYAARLGCRIWALNFHPDYDAGHLG